VQAKVTSGRKLRLDATCVQNEIHHPRQRMLVDSVRVLSRFVKGAKELVKEQVSYVERTCRSRLRTAKDGTNAASAVESAKAKTKKLSRTALSEAHRDYGADGATGHTRGEGLNGRRAEGQQLLNRLRP